jgi:hydrogenase maturation protease
VQRVLIIGYGNRLRTDDGIGIAAAESLAKFYRDNSTVRVITAHLLTPERASEIAEAEYVLFLDAVADGIPGTIRRRQITAENGTELLTHHLTPAALLYLAKRLYGRTPTAISLTISAASLEMGMDLSPVVTARMPELLQAAKHFVANCRGLFQPSNGKEYWPIL